jgi:hypothetical protein
VGINGLRRILKEFTFINNQIVTTKKLPDSIRITDEYHFQSVVLSLNDVQKTLFFHQAGAIQSGLNIPNANSYNAHPIEIQN